MDSQTRSSRARSIDLPKPETGLAEWTSKIKAMQRQVDADDEDEQKKLEEEIAASRIARMRRSRGVGNGSRVNSLDLSQNPEFSSALKSDSPGNGIPVDRQTDQEDALRKLMGSRGLSSPTRSTQERQPTSPLAQSQTKPESMSLAAFMGGRATGPRLNKHAPQQDAHDPTQFEQRTRVNAPHPVFGRGGIAMPGMVAKGPKSPLSEMSTHSQQMSERDKSQGGGTGPDRLEASHTPSTSKPQVEVLSPPTSTPVTNTGNGYRSRDRAISISSGTSRAKSPYSRPTESIEAMGTDNGDNHRLEPHTEKRSVTGRSPSPAASHYSRGKTPEPSPQTMKQEPEHISRDYAYDSPNTYRGLSPAPIRPVKGVVSAPPPIAKKPEPVSLAAFIGGRASGPRLNKPVPQQDAHDPTQFEQRRNITSPHPVFGRGGVAMPGMGAKETSAAKFRASGQFGSSTSGSQPSIEHAEEQSVSSPNDTGRERTFSTPSENASRETTPAGYTNPEYGHRLASRSSIPNLRSKTPTDSGQSTPSHVSRPYTPSQTTTSISPTSSSQKSSPVSIPSLARPIQPVPRQSPTGPQIPASKNPSRAFLRPTAEKAPTPSLTRLMGRGFVQNMVQTSSDLEAEASEFGVSTPEKSRNMSPRKSSVLDRWLPATSTGSASPPISPKPAPVRKSRTIEPTWVAPDMTAGPPSPSHSTDTSRSLKTVASLPSMTQTVPSRPSSRTSKKDIPIVMPPQDTPGLGSSSTLISYIKPSKTGDDPQTTSVVGPSEAHPATDGKTEAGKKASTSELPVSSGQPLNHPTKGRAKKPRKDSKQVKFQESPPKDLNNATYPLTVPRAELAPAAQPAHVLHTAASSDAHGFEETTDPHRAVPANRLQQNPSRITDRWADQAIIGVKTAPPSKPLIEERLNTAQSESNGLLGRRALPGLTTPTPQPPTDVFKHEEKADRSPSTPLSPGRHARIPSTGNRATVMDVAQSWNDQHAHEVSLPANSVPTIPQYDISPPAESPEDLEKLADAIPRPRHMSPPSVHSEKRKSSYEKYSAIVLPSLPEEKTPAPSPVVTLSRTTAQTQVEPKQAALNIDSLQESLKGPMRPESVPTPEAVMSDVIYINHNDSPLPDISVDTLLNTRPLKFSPESDTLTISVDVMTIQKTTATTLTKDPNVFYDTEVLAIIYRSKSKSTGLVSTKMWSWQGKRSQLGEKELSKLQELAKRYGTNLETVHQYQEPPQLLRLLDDQIAIRQGTRAHWTSENTAMHSVRLLNGSIFIEEHDLNIRNLCSGFSYCLTILDTLYVWHGRGSIQQERDAALKYAHGLAAKGSTVVELIEGESDDDEMFWMMLGDDDFATADYWRWRRSSPDSDPRIWRIDTSKNNNMAEYIPFFSGEDALRECVYVIDCVWEFYVLVGPHARGKRRDIRLAAFITQEMARQISSKRPFKPTTHVLILPSQIPVDLKLHFRDLDEAFANEDNIPDHMNIVSLSETLEQLQRTSWDKSALKDLTMLPVGLEPSTVP